MLKDQGFKPAKATPLIYTAIEGKTSGFPVFEVIHYIGRTTALHRLRDARARLGDA